ncbi:MAG TPA: hypothetical protein EYP18_10635, partial [Desulfobacterales bacterium]|nr:hypothetical protein [Desulfobacterales bacterium]
VPCDGTRPIFIAHREDGQEIVGNRTKVKVVKDKVAPPFQLAEFDIVYGEGISKAGDLLDLAVEQDIVDKSGSWYSYQDERIGQGRENAKRFLQDHPEMFTDIDQKVRMGFGLVDLGEGASESSEDESPEAGE